MCLSQALVHTQERSKLLLWQGACQQLVLSWGLRVLKQEGFVSASLLALRTQPWDFCSLGALSNGVKKTL